MEPFTLILGAGRSAYGAARYLLKQGASVRISDLAHKYPDEIEKIKSLGLSPIIGPQTAELLSDCSQLIVSPGLSPDILILQEARRRGIPILSEIDLALKEFSGSVIGVTGTNGKSTTTCLIAHLLKHIGIYAEASGNIGIPPSLLLAEGKAPTTLVLELSSYQLDFSQSIRNISSVFMSFSEDHMERHKTLENYFFAKWKLLQATVPNGYCIVPRTVLQFAKKFQAPRINAPIAQVLIDDERPVKRYEGPHIRFNTKRGEISGGGIIGKRALPSYLSFHNKINFLTAALAVQSVQKTPWDDCVQALQDFHWLPYRFERIGTIQGFPVYNDSKSTNVESTLFAMKSQGDKCILMLGGFPKGESFAAIETFRDRIGLVIAFGQAASKIAADLHALKPLSFPTLAAAMKELPDIFKLYPGPVCFSPACSSFDEFKNFEDRGLFFNQQINDFLDQHR